MFGCFMIYAGAGVNYFTIYFRVLDIFYYAIGKI